jgi:ribosomal protein L3 glutamine methyltransferase
MTTILETIERLGAQFENASLAFGHGVDNAFDEAVWLTLWRLGLPLDDLDGVASRVLSTAEEAAIQTVADERIATRKPLAYLTQEAWLQGVPFYVDERCIVPRSLIAEVIANGDIDPWLNEATHRALDLCCGNANLAILAAMAWPDLTLDALDISQDALDVARINLERHGLSDRIQLIQSDGLARANPPYDLILCNPPYVNTDSMSRLPAEYRTEPALALEGGLDGMDFIRKILRDIPSILSEHGVLVLEIGHERAHFEQAFPELAAKAVWLATEQAEDQVLLLERENFTQGSFC